MHAPLQLAYQTQGFSAGHQANDIGWISYGVRDPIIMAYDDGVVVESQFELYGGGNTISIKHEGNGEYYYLTRYCHLKSRSVLLNDKVIAGQQIGIGGTTGNSTGPHLHYEIWVCPASYVYKGINSAARNAYVRNPETLLFLQGETINLGGYRTMSIKIDLTKQITATVKEGLAVRLRDKPTTASLSLGLVPNNTPIACLGITDAIDGYQWLALYYNNRLCFSAADFYTLSFPVSQTITVEKIVEVEKPINAILNDGRFEVTIKTIAAK